MNANTEIEVSLIDVLQAVESEPQTPGDSGVFDELAWTGAGCSKGLGAIWSADDLGMLREVEINWLGERRTCSVLSDLGIETLARHRFDEQTRVTGKTARGVLADIEAEMDGDA